MTTLKQKLKTLMIQRGLVEPWAETVFGAVEADPANESMKGRWDDEADGYPIELLAGLWVSACTHAVEWMDANKPKAWFRHLFAQDALPSKKVGAGGQ